MRKRPDYQDFNRQLLELDELTGRELLIVGAAYLDVALELAIEHALPVELSNTRRERFFGSDRGVAGSFSSKIDLAFVLGLCPEVAATEMHAIRDLRNEAAHGLALDASWVERRVSNLSFWRDPRPRGTRAWAQQVETLQPHQRFDYLGRAWTFDTLVVTSSDGEVLFAMPCVPDDGADGLSTDEILRYELYALMSSVVDSALAVWLRST